MNLTNLTIQGKEYTLFRCQTCQKWELKRIHHVSELRPSK